MNLGQYHRRPDMHGLPMDFEYAAENSDTSTQSTHRMLSFDGLPRAQPDQHLMTSNPTLTNILSNDHSHINPMSMSMPQLSLSWPNPAQITSGFDDQENNYYDYSPTVAGSNHEGAFLRDMNFEVPRWIPNEMTGNVISDNTMSLDSFEPSAYITDSNKLTHHHHHVSADFPFNSLENARDFSRLSLSGSPPPKQEQDDVGVGAVSFNRAPFRLPSNDISEDGGPSSREMTVVDGDDHPADEPYAKLIHRALMSAPNHSMVLQEIYQWFRENTNKGSSDSKGWMNSIRHNLSMNAAFKKTERKIPGDETKKSTEWVLENFAIRDGVQSTTRYRKGTNGKKFMRSDHPAPARQISGSKGGIVTRNTKLQRQRVQEELRGTRRSTQRIDSARRDEFHQQMARSHQAQRPRSPLTPPSANNHSSSPYFFGKNSSQLDLTYNDGFGLEDVQGVYTDGPLFSDIISHHNSLFHAGHTLSSQRF